LFFDPAEKNQYVSTKKLKIFFSRTLSVVLFWTSSKANFGVQIQVVVVSWNFLLDFLLVQNEPDVGAFLNHSHIVPVPPDHRDFFAHHNLHIKRNLFEDIKNKGSALTLIGDEPRSSSISTDWFLIEMER
jgi:hypothetical protein